jgi:hypothetical protein
MALNATKMLLRSILATAATLLVLEEIFSIASYLQCLGCRQSYQCVHLVTYTEGCLRQMALSEPGHTTSAILTSNDDNRTAFDGLIGYILALIDFLAKI